VIVPLAQVAGVRQSFPSAALKEPGVVNLALIAYPNVLLDVEPPLELRSSKARSIADRLEEPAAFARALERLLPRPGAD
jgi:hypothetical protein